MKITPINVDVKASAKDYAGLDDDQLLVTSVFPTVQGEGPFFGHRAVFVRLAGCNLGGKGAVSPGCDFCDTDFRLANGVPYRYMDLWERVESLYPSDSPGLSSTSSKRLVVVTGGEPMLQRNLVGWLHKARELGRDYIVQIESNGTRLLQIPTTNCHLVVSPKIPMPSKVHGYHRLSQKVLDRADALKFVVSSDDTSPYHNLPGYAFKFAESGRPVFVSPMAIYNRRPGSEVASIWTNGLFDIGRTSANHEYAAKLVMRFGLRLNLQAHLYCNVP